MKDFFKVAPDIYPVGRLDYDSEGLLILSNDKALNHRLLNPVFAHQREYWVQVEGEISGQAIHQLQEGVAIPIDGGPYITRRCVAQILRDPETPQRIPPIRYRKNIQTSWISLTLKEGKNRQVRKMTAAVGYPTLRLIRVKIESINLAPLLPGEIKELSRQTIYSRLFHE